MGSAPAPGQRAGIRGQRLEVSGKLFAGEVGAELDEDDEDEGEDPDDGGVGAGGEG